MELVWTAEVGREANVLATASTPAEPRVLRVATSQVRGLPTWSTYSIFLRATHLESVVKRSVTLVMTGSCVLCAMVRDGR